jgi:glycosyltransferase involved in cell wall biosynthesis
MATVGSGAAKRSMVVICIPTWQRPAWLTELLAALAALDEPADDVDVRVVVIDNDEAGSAAPIVKEMTAGLRWPLEYVIEATRGIAATRNRAVETAIALGADFIVFIDDDEAPTPGWLRELVRVQRLSGADVVLGPVTRDLPATTPRWIVESGYFDRESRVTGTSMLYASTNNVLIAEPLLRRHAEPFNTAFGLSGGEDTHFFERAIGEGATIVWADDALVTEKIPPSRLNLRWMLKREYRRGNTLSVCLRDLYDSPLRRARRAGQGLLRIVQGTGILLRASVRGRAAAAKGLLRIAFGAGLLSGLVRPVSFHEYDVVHGR